MNDNSRWLTNPMFEELHDLLAWRRGSPTGELSLIDYFACTSTPDGFFATAELLWPSLVTVDNVRFIRSRFSQEAYDAWRARGEDNASIQRMLNHIHVRALFAPDILSDDMAVAIAHAIADFWSRIFAPERLMGVASGSDVETAQISLVDAE
jgi:hypothetical protein